jgi:S1-C subfamily serine protease
MYKYYRSAFILFMVSFFASLWAAEPSHTLVIPDADGPGAVPSPVAASVVQIFASQRPPDLYQPWLRRPVQEASGSGVVIEGNRILTNAHVVTYATQVLVRGNDSSEKVLARVVLLAPEIDLAVLAVGGAVPRGDMLSPEN